MTSIEWTKIKPGMKVMLVGKKGSQYWEADGKLVTFSSRDVYRAQTWLRLRSNKQ